MRTERADRTKTALSLVLASATVLTLGTTAAAAGATKTEAAFKSRVFASAARLVHATPDGPETITQPDDITFLGSKIFVGFQNGVGPQGQPSSTGNRDSTIVEFSRSGRAVGQWDVVGKCDGVTADPGTGDLIATVNEDANSSLYIINPSGGTAPVHYRYNRPLPSKGGTDAISVYGPKILISASAPGTTGLSAPRPTYPAVYRVVLNPNTHVATIHSLFSDEAGARVANVNAAEQAKRERLALTDPDSNEVVPMFARRFGGDFMLTSQGDKEQIFVHGAAGPHQWLSVLRLSDSVDDTAWASDAAGSLYVTDNSDDTIYRITGPFVRGSAFVADTPCDAANAPATCPGPGFPANYLGRLNPTTGVITRVRLFGPSVEPQGMLFLPS